MHPWHPYPHPCLAPPLPRAAEQGEVRGWGVSTTRITTDATERGATHPWHPYPHPCLAPSLPRPPARHFRGSRTRIRVWLPRYRAPPARHFRGSRAFRVELPAVSNNVAVAR
jgi:hypothetical protein